jgi:hypothetical protein
MARRRVSDGGPKIYATDGRSGKPQVSDCGTQSRIMFMSVPDRVSIGSIQFRKILQKLCFKAEGIRRLSPNAPHVNSALWHKLSRSEVIVESAGRSAGFKGGL